MTLPHYLPAALREAPPLADPRTEGGQAFIASLLAPVRSGVILLRDDLVRLGEDTGLACRAGERALRARRVPRARSGGHAAMASMPRAGVEREGGGAGSGGDRTVVGGSRGEVGCVDVAAGRGRRGGRGRGGPAVMGRSPSSGGWKDRRGTSRDVVAGLSVALLIIPQSMAYAELAGLPSVHGLYASAVPLVAAGLLASCPYLQTGPVALTALLTHGALVTIAVPGSPEYVGAAALLALVVGVARLAIGFIQAGKITYLMSQPVLRGFTSGASILILLSQFPSTLGMVGGSESGLVGNTLQVLRNPGSWSVAAAVLTALTVAATLLARRIHVLFPGALVAVIGGVLFSALAGYGGPIVGEIPGSLPPFSLTLPWPLLPQLVFPGAVIALVGFAESTAISRSFATQDRVAWNPDREFVAQGGGEPGVGGLWRTSGGRIVFAQQPEPPVGGPVPLVGSGDRSRGAGLPAVREPPFGAAEGGAGRDRDRRRGRIGQATPAGGRLAAVADPGGGGMVHPGHVPSAGSQDRASPLAGDSRVAGDPCMARTAGGVPQLDGGRRAPSRGDRHPLVRVGAEAGGGDHRAARPRGGRFGGGDSSGGAGEDRPDGRAWWLKRVVEELGQSGIPATLTGVPPQARELIDNVFGMLPRKSL